MRGAGFEQLQRHPLLLPAPVRIANGSTAVEPFLAELCAAEQLSAADLVQRQGAALTQLAQHAIVHSAHFAGRLAAAALSPAALADGDHFARLPPLTRRELVGAGESLFCRAHPAAHGSAAPTSTSGSTGEPVTVRRTDLCGLYWHAYTLREHLWHERDFSGRLATVRANLAAPADMPDWGPPANLFVRTGPWSGRPASCSVEELCTWLCAWDPDYFLVLPSTLAGIVGELERTGRRFPRLRGVRTLSETVSTRLRDEVRRVLGVPIDDIYTSQECGVIATQCLEQGNYHVSESIILEVVDQDGRACRPGETGRILVTDLLNFATPLVRYEIGDYAEAGPAAPCPCGRPTRTLRRILGRERNLVLLPDGTRHWPVVGFHRWDEVHPIRQFQLIQVDRQTIVARMCAEARPTAEQESQLTEIIQEALGYPFAIRYEWHDGPLPRGPGGKFEEFVCRV
jgi:phenylacetate-CoA ligase